MPTYEYKCTNDGSTFDIWQEVGSAPPPCPDCGAPSKKVFAPPCVIFKGSGFYVTDMRAESGGGKSGDSKSENSESSSDKASESKPAATTETKTETKSEAPKAEAKSE